MQLTIKTFPKRRPNITLQKIFEHLEEVELASGADYEPSNKEIRLAIDLANQMAPMKLDREDTVRSILQCDISNERIKAVKSFKEILYEKRIEIVNGKPRTVKRLRKRNSSK